jgi:hypothetical protein
MFNPLELETDDTSVVFRDLVFTMMLLFSILFLAAVVHINPVAKEQVEDTVPPGTVMVDVGWTDGLDVDVDLWVKAPLDTRPVGYSNRSGIQFNLLRDDLGMIGDSTPRNYENAYTRGLDDGEYVVNLHMYNNRSPVVPIPVTVVVKMRACDTCGTVELYSTTIDLQKNGDEVTVVRFKIEDEVLVQDSVHRIPVGLRQWRAQ